MSFEGSGHPHWAEMQCSAENTRVEGQRTGQSGKGVLYCSADPLPGGVIGSTPVSGSGSWGSSPCPAALTGSVTIAERFNGPPGSGNGGYVCGLVASEVGTSAQVTLFQPPPLGVPLVLQRTVPGVVRLLNGDAVVAEGRDGTPTVSLPSPPSIDEAREAAERYAALDPAEHPYPTCFVCGPAHPSGPLSVGGEIS